MAATITVDFDANPRTIYIPTGGSIDIRFIDKSSTNNGVVNSWAWYINSGGWAPFSTDQHPILTFAAGAGTYDIKLEVNDSGSTGVTTLIKTGFIVIEEGTFTPPLQNTPYRNITLFVYEQDVAAPNAACICRSATTSCNLYYTNLKFQGAMTKPGKATFTIVDPGDSTATERDLFESVTNAKYKNIAIICGYDVAWSGKITKSVKTRKSQPGATTQKATYTVEAYTDIKKLADWNIKTPQEITASPGAVCAEILDPDTGEPDFIGTGFQRGYIDTSGPSLAMTLSDVDKYTAFTSLVNACDHDWRTRMDTQLYTYSSYNSGTRVTTVDSAGLTVDALIGQWILFPTNYYFGGFSGYELIPNNLGILSWGLITDNDATTITVTSMSGSSKIPDLYPDNCLVLNVPRLDISSDLGEPDSIRDFTNNTRGITTFTDLDEKYDLFTKVVSKGSIKQIDGSNKTVALSIAAKDLWNETDRQYENTTFVTKKCEGKIIYHQVSSSVVYLEGTGYAFTSGDLLHFIMKSSDGTTINVQSRTLDTITEFPDGIGTGYDVDPETICTVLNINAYSGNYLNQDVPDGCSTDSFVMGSKLYVDSPTRIAQSGATTDIYVGAEGVIRTCTNASAGTDAVFGGYVYIDATPTVGDDSAMGFTKTAVYPHNVGCLVSNDTYTEAAPQTGSPIDKYGVITKALTLTTNTNADLEVAATHALLQGSQYYQKSTILMSYYQFTVNRVRYSPQITLPAMIREGQTIGVVPYTGGSIIYRQVILWELDTKTMVVTVTLGDYQKDYANLINATTAATQKTLI